MLTWVCASLEHLLPEATPADIAAAVRAVHHHLWRDGGCIAQCEFGPAARPENVRAVFAARLATNAWMDEATRAWAGR